VIHKSQMDYRFGVVSFVIVACIMLLNPSAPRYKGLTVASCLRFFLRKLILDCWAGMAWKDVTTYEGDSLVCNRSGLYELEVYL